MVDILFKANEFYGDIVSSEEESMHWISKEELENVNLVSDFNELLNVMLNSQVMVQINLPMNLILSWNG